MNFEEAVFSDDSDGREYNPRLGIYPRRYSHDDDQNLDTFCAVCGVPLRVIGEVLSRVKDKEKYKWLLDGVCIRPSSLEQRHAKWEHQRFHGYGKPLEVLPIQDNFVFFQWREIYGRNSRFIFQKWELFPWVGIHSKCFDLMKRLVEYRTDVLRLVPDEHVLRIPDESSTHVPASLGEMYEVYQSRIYKMPDVTWHHLMKCAWKVLEPHLYYHDEYLYYDTDVQLFKVHGAYLAKDGNLGDDRPMELFKMLEWPFGSPDVDQYEASPFPIDDLLPRILSYLQPLPAESTITSPTLQARLDRLPIEIQEQIYQNLHPFTDPAVECTRHLAPSVWKALLFQGQIFPWLWDLDQSDSTMSDEDTLATSMQHMSINNGRDSVDADDDAWDWELLARQLAQYDAFEPGTIMQDMPWALWNRRRIWRLLDEARRDDVDPADFTDV